MGEIKLSSVEDRIRDTFRNGSNPHRFPVWVVIDGLRYEGVAYGYIALYLLGRVFDHLFIWTMPQMDWASWLCRFVRGYIAVALSVFIAWALDLDVLWVWAGVVILVRIAVSICRYVSRRILKARRERYGRD